MLARLQSENWDDMTAAANASSNHVMSLDRWTRIARERNPSLSEQQVARLAEQLRTDHYRGLGRSSGESRRERAAAGTLPQTRESRCSRCHKAGHNVRTCPAPEGELAA